MSRAGMPGGGQFVCMSQSGADQRTGAPTHAAAGAR
jgi:hypothetical protein